MSSDDDDDEDPKLPHDVAVEVLKRLPVESLLRCRCVCRSWRSAIDDPRFVALHLTHSALGASNWHLVSLDWRDPLQYTCSLFPNGSLGLPSQSQIEIPVGTPPYSYLCVGSCNGLICVREYTRMGFLKTMYLWNLFTREHRAVRRPGLEHRLFSLATTYEALGFGFHSRSNDYKIVRILYVLDDNGRCVGGTEPRVEIYSLRADSWRGLACEVPALCHDDRAVFLNGNLHWFASSKFGDLGEEGGCGLIVLFDVGGEVFDEMAPPPEEISHADSMALVMSVACGVVAGFDGFTRNGELLIELDGGERVSWNPITGQFTNLPLSMQCDLVTIVESLVSL